jgi:hypothetical protein
VAEKETDVGRALTAALYRIFTAVARVALRRGVPFDAVAEVAKRAFVDVAYREFTIPRRKQSASRVSVLTGIHRKEIGRLKAAAGPRDDEAANRITCAAGVVAAWHRDRTFTDRRGMPAALPFDKSTPCFSDLVKRYGKGDIPARAVLDELVRVNAVTRQRDGRIRLLATAYVPETTSPEALAILGSDVSDLISAIDHNLAAAPGAGFFQRKVAYDNLPSEALAEIRARVETEGQGVLEKLDRTIAKHDRDSNPKVSGEGRKRAMVGVYYFESDVTENGR